MLKIKVEIEVPNSEYCDDDEICQFIENSHFGQSWCSLYGDDLEVDKNKYYCFKRCDKCKQAEVKNESLGMVSK